MSDFCNIELKKFFNYTIIDPYLILRSYINSCLSTNLIVAKIFNQKLGPNCQQLAIAFNNSVSRNSQNITKRDYKLEDIEFFDLDYKKSGLIVTINRYIYY